jgi:hypothetical protein
VDEEERTVFDAEDVKGLDLREADDFAVAAEFGLVTQTGGFGGFGISRGPLLCRLSTRTEHGRRGSHQKPGKLRGGTAVGCGKVRPLKISITLIEILDFTSQPS